MKCEATKTALVGVTLKQTKVFRASPNVRALEAAGYDIIVGSRIGQFVQTIALDIRPGGLDLARGVLKIAISFALQAGVDSALIRHFVDDDRALTADRSAVDRAVSPCYPTGWCEAAYEADRYATDDFPRTITPADVPNVGLGSYRDYASDLNKRPNVRA